MKFFPTLTEVKEIAKTGKYDILPVSCEILSDFITPIEAMRILQNVSTHCYLLESAQANEAWGRYTFLGYDPKLEINCIDGHMKLGKLSVETENPSEYIRQILSEYKSPKFDYLPSFTGGLVGYFSYDYLGYKEKSIRGKARDTEDFKDVDLMLFDKVIAFDNLCQKIILIANMSLDAPETGYNKAIVELKQLRELLMHGEKKQNMGGKLLGEVTPLPQSALCFLSVTLILYLSASASITSNPILCLVCSYFLSGFPSPTITYIVYPFSFSYHLQFKIKQILLDNSRHTLVALKIKAVTIIFVQKLLYMRIYRKRIHMM